MKKPLLLLAIATLLSLPSFAQWSIGGSLVYSYNQPFRNHNKYNYFHYIGHGGPSIDLLKSWQIDDQWSAIVGLSFQQKGYSTYTKGYYSYVRCNDWFFSLPVMAEFSFAKTKSGEFYVDAGLYASYRCCSNRSYFVTNGNYSWYFVIEPMKYKISFNEGNRFECGLIGGIGYKWCICTKWTGFATACYQYALTKQFSEPQTLSYLDRNSGVVLKLGVLYNLSKK